MRTMLVAAVLALLSSATAAGAEPRPAAASDWAATEHGAVRLVAGVTAVGHGTRIPMGLQFRMNPGWHIYWRSPGDAGYPPRIDWTGSENLASGDLAWPAPHRFTVLDLQTIGYADAVTLPISAVPERPGAPMRLTATVDYLTCADICVPYVAELALSLASGPAEASPFSHDIARALARVPDEKSGALSVVGVSLEGSPDVPRLSVRIASDEPLAAPDVFVEAPAPLAFSAPEAEFSRDRRSATLTLTVYNGESLGGSLDRLPVTATVVDGDRALEQRTHIGEPATAGPVANRDKTAETTTLLALGLALLGGLVLNLMPCVLPVLSMKLLAVVGHGGGQRRAVRAGFLAAAAGILTAFMILAGVLAVLKASGAAVGWGLQFQHPWFLTAMILVVVAFAGNLWGIFQVPLPRAFGLAGERAGRVQGLAGHFLTGTLATLLATPCSAPFLGTAVGFALSRGTAEIFAIFAAVGTGLALPYLLVAAAPSLATRLPKPGPWMAVLRRLLGFALVGTAAWLVWVLAGQVGWPGALSVAALATGALVALAAGALIPGRRRKVSALAALAFGLAAFVAPPTGPGEARLRQEGAWQPFQPERIPGLIAEGRVVFVNVTADWCITCKVNERVVLAREPVSARLADSQVVAMRADWTAPDEAIARYLASFGRYGIPFDAVYGPGLPVGETLPELLTPDAVMSALGRADAKVAGR
jgi:suppressor for copper-sensitivity B